MLDDIRFTIPAVAKKAYVQELTHFRIRGGRITGYDGVLTLSSAIDLDVDARPEAKKFLAAVRACAGTISLHTTSTGRLCVRADPFRAFVPCLPEDEGYLSEPQGDTVEVGPGFFAGVRALAPLMGVDASRPWAMGVKARGECLYATNNVMVGQYWHGTPFPHDVVIPARAVEELLRQGEAPDRVQVCETSATFWWGERRWLKTNLLEGGAWPLERLEGAMDAAPGQELSTLPEGFAAAVASLKPFIDEKDPAVYLGSGGLSTSRGAGEGADVTLALGVPGPQCYGYRQMELLPQVATAVDWRHYPRPCTFAKVGEPLRGLIIGRRM